MEAKTSVFLALAICSLFIDLAQCSQLIYQGKWKLLKRSIGVSAMHMALLPNDKVIIFDRTDAGPSNLTLPQEKCARVHHQSTHEATDCYAHSVEFNPANRDFRPLTISTDTWCSSGALSQDGVLIQSGGYDDGYKVVRYFKPCLDCDWIEEQNGLIVPRWYASNQVLPDGRIIVVGGRFQFNYEFIPKTSTNDKKLYQLPFLEETMHLPKVPNNLYPFLHLSTDGNLFIFANDRAVLFDYVHNKVVTKFPVMPGGVSRNYPSTGSSALLPISLVGNKSSPSVEVLVCGGTFPDSNVKANAGIYMPASKSCGRLIITEKNPNWEMEEMPINRVMGDMILLPTGDVLIINGAACGTAGWAVAREPVLNPVLYKPNHEKTGRFELMSPTTIPRLYHSTAHLLSDGRVLVGGSNPNVNYNFTTLYPTELSLEAFYPPYLSTSSRSRPSIGSIKPGVDLTYLQKFYLGFKTNYVPEKIYVTMVAPSFTTHSFAMNQRVLVLDFSQVGKNGNISGSKGYINLEGFAPARPELAPPGYYLLFVVCDGIPSRGMWVRIKKL